MNLTDHLRAPAISINEHIVQRGSELSAAIGAKIPIYLDTRFWVMVREVRDGTSQRDDEREIVRLLDAIVSGGIGFCPIAESTFSELMKQGKVDRRLATATVIDELSLGVTLLPHEYRLIAEAEAFLGSRLVPSGHLAFNPWTRLAYVLGNVYPTDTSFTSDIETAIQKAFYDHLWDRPLVDVALAIDHDSYHREAESIASAEALASANKRHAAEMRSFAEVREAEFHTVAEFVVEHMEQLLSLSADLTAMGSKARPILTNALREIYKNPEQARHVPTGHVEASLHALFRWEYRDRDITANDLIDFRHAAAALGHCRLMLTEAGLRKALNHKRISLAELHGCTVLSDRTEIVTALRRIAASA